MASEKFDFGEFLAVLEAKRAALDALIGTYRAALSLGALGQPGDVDVTAYRGQSGPGGGAAIELPQGALLGKSLPAAIHLYLSAARRKQTTKEIVTALREGGVESTSRNFENTVATALYRLKSAGAVFKFNDGWGLTEFYPESIRSRFAAQTDHKMAKKSAPKARKRTPKKRARVLALPTGEQPKTAAG